MSNLLSLGQVSSALDQGSFRLFILPTEKCNFRCTYCYEDFSLGVMPSHIVSSVKKFIDLKAEKLSSFRISWFGGEPLLAKSIVAELSLHAKNIFGANFKSDMTTNFYYADRDVVSELIQSGVNEFQVSLDGLEEDHDKTRVLKGGGRTFSRIYENLLSVRNSNDDFSITLRLHYTLETIERLPFIVEKLSRDFLADSRFRIFPKKIERLGGANDNLIGHIDPKIEQDIISSVFGSKEEEGCSLCYAAMANSIIIRSDGTLAKCTVAFNNPANKIGKITEGGFLDIDQQKYISWMHPLFSMNAEDGACPLVKIASVP